MASYIMGESAVTEEETWSDQEETAGCCCCKRSKETESTSEDETEMEETRPPAVLVPVQETSTVADNSQDVAIPEYHIVQAVAEDGSGRIVFVALPFLVCCIKLFCNLKSSLFWKK